jgi:hypothetical protein
VCEFRDQEVDQPPLAGIGGSPVPEIADACMAGGGMVRMDQVPEVTKKAGAVYGADLPGEGVQFLCDTEKFLSQYLLVRVSCQGIEKYGNCALLGIRSAGGEGTGSRCFPERGPGMVNGSFISFQSVENISGGGRVHKNVR